MMQLMPILSNYQEGSRNAKVYQTHNGEFGVIVYDWTFDYDFKRIKERVEATFVAMPDSVMSHDDFEAWIKAQ